jgi:hypothetical protein
MREKLLIGFEPPVRRLRAGRRSIGGVFLGLVLVLPIALFGQQKFPHDLWHDGKIVLDTRDTVRGFVKYNMQNDMVQLQVRNGIETYTARKAVFFEIFDQTVRQYRQFFSLPYANGAQYKTPVFFELLQEGKITLLCREYLQNRTYSPYYAYGGYTRLVLVNRYFFLKEDGSIVDFSGKKNDLLDLMGSKADQVRDFIKENRLNFDNKYHVSRIVEYYNSFFK